MGGGQVPGHAGNFLLLKDAEYKKPSLSSCPFPTHFPQPHEDLASVEELFASSGPQDPFLKE